MTAHLKSTCSAIFNCVIGGVLLGLFTAAFADDAPLSYVAEPDVYKVLAENDQMRVILATWKPGQRDKFHSHPMTAAYYVNDCMARIHTPDGNVREVLRKANTAQIGPAVASHSFENVSKMECSIVLVERK